MANAYSYRTAREDDWSDIVLLLSEAFIEDSTDEWAEIEHGVFEPDRTVLVETETGEKAGVSAAFTRDLITPGGVVPAAHVTMVSVSSLHRRRGILTNMISRLHDEGLRRQEPVAVLWASEGRIYQRFGYGLGALRHRLEIDLSETEFRPDARPAGDGSLRKGSMADLDSLIKVYDQVFRDRPGWSSRDERWWTYVTSDPKEGRNGATAQRITLHEGPDGVDGYMLWRAKAEWNSPTAAGTVIVRELTASNPEAYRALWQHAMSVDLTRNVVLRMGATDEPLTSLLTEPRAMGARAMDSLWVRILSVPEALAARRYAAPIDVVLDVADRDFPDNNRRWRLVGSPDAASCAPTDDPADLSLDIATLSSAYLGGLTLGALGAGGRVRELKPGALATASIAFGWHRQPSAIESF